MAGFSNRPVACSHIAMGAMGLPPVHVILRGGGQLWIPKTQCICDVNSSTCRAYVNFFYSTKVQSASATFDPIHLQTILLSRPNFLHLQSACSSNSLISFVFYVFLWWQRVHGYNSLIRPRLHPSLHSTSIFREHFRDIHLSSISEKIYISHWFLRLPRPLWPSLYVYSGPSLALFSGGKECMATLHSSDQDFTFLYILHLHCEHFRISDNAVNPQTSLVCEHLSYILCYKHFRGHLQALNNAICFI